MRTQILGSGFVTGQNLVSNDQLARMMDTSDDWIREATSASARRTRRSRTPVWPRTSSTTSSSPP